MGTKIKIKTKIDKIDNMNKGYNSLNGKKVKVGVLEGDHKWLAGIHEFGCTITPKNSQYLTVPVNPKAVGKKASDFKNLFVFTASSGEKFLAKEVGKDKLVIYYWLTKSVTIPERSFLRAGYDANIKSVIGACEKLIDKTAHGEISEDTLLKAIGLQLSTAIKKYARDLNSPANTKATQEAKGSSNPLADTGEMINGITYRIE